MSFVDQNEDLLAKHHELEAAIDTENNRPHPDDLIVADLKKQKLRIKEEIEHIEH